MKTIITLLSFFGCMNITAQNKIIDQKLQKEIKKSPSINYLIFNRDTVLYEKQIGFSDLKKNIATNKKTTFNAFSITKTFTALAILQLAEKGKLDIDKPAKYYLSEFPYSSEITVKQLLNHTSGIPNPVPLNWIHLKKEHQEFNRNKFFKNIFKKKSKTKSEPNKKFAYSNLGYVLLGQIIENVSKKSYEEYINTQIIEKLGIENELGFEIKETHAKGYHKKWSFMNLILGLFIDKSKFMNSEKGKWNSFNDYYLNGPSYGGLIGTPNSLMIYLQELLKPNSNLISNKYKSLLFTENYTTNNKPTKMCLSWFKGDLNGNEYYTHAGGGGGFYSEIRIYPELGIGSVIMFNRTGMKDERFLDKLDKYFIKQ